MLQFKAPEPYSHVPALFNQLLLPISLRWILQAGSKTLDLEYHGQRIQMNDIQVYSLAGKNVLQQFF